nr:unnamed protein product [Digitaria exilis]
MTGLDADATAQAASTPHARRPAFLAPAAERHAGSVLPPVSAAEHATRHLGRRGRQSTAPAGEARQDGAMPMRVCEVVGLGRGGTREAKLPARRYLIGLSVRPLFSRLRLSSAWPATGHGAHVTLEASRTKVWSRGAVEID